MVANIEIIIQGQSHENRFAFLPGAWYNKAVISQTLHRQHHKKAVNMSNTNPIRKTILTVIAVFLIVASFAGCETTKEINEDYLVVSSMAVIPNEEERGALTLKIEGDYAESAWGIRSIEQETTGNAIVLTGTLVSEGQGAFEYEVKIPPHVDVVKFNNRVLWTRKP